MSVAYQRISNAKEEDIVFYDPAADRRAAALGVSWDAYFKVSSQEWLYKLEFGWWRKYCDTVAGSTYYKNDAAGKLVTSFNPKLLMKNDQTLIRLDTFGAVMVLYQSLVSDVSNLNEVDKANYEFAKERCQDEWIKALELMNFYDLSGDGSVTKLEENSVADADFFNGNRRHF